MTHQTSALEGALLDAAVAKIEQVTVETDGQRCWLMNSFTGLTYEPSRQWRDGGPLIERERIEIEFIDASDGTWCAYVNPNASFHCSLQDGKTGPSPLIAAMRAFVSSNLGDEVDL